MYRFPADHDATRRGDKRVPRRGLGEIQTLHKLELHRPHARTHSKTLCRPTLNSRVREAVNSLI
jgi:hypothetical protein